MSPPIDVPRRSPKRTPFSPVTPLASTAPSGTLSSSPSLFTPHPLACTPPNSAPPSPASSSAAVSVPNVMSDFFAAGPIPIPIPIPVPGESEAAAAAVARADAAEISGEFVPPHELARAERARLRRSLGGVGLAYSPDDEARLRSRKLENLRLY